MKIRRDGALPRVLLGLLVVAAAVAAFAPALDNGFVTWDDGSYIVDNPGIRALAATNLRWMSTTSKNGLWQPLTWLSLAVDYKLWNLDAFGYHLMNLLLHALAALLFYRVCLDLFDRAAARAGSEAAAWCAALSALFFAVHPLRVESVAWATERKDVLSGVFLFAAIALYLRGRRLAAPACFALSLAVKGAGVALPAALVVLEIYPLRRLPADPRRWLAPRHRPLWLGLAPFAVLGLGGAALNTAAGVARDVIHPLSERGLLLRAGQVAYSLVFYPWKTAFPANLAAYYPPGPWFGSWSWPLWACAAAAGCAAGAAWLLARRGRPLLAAALAAYVALLLPSSGIAQLGIPFSACDRYSYISCLPFALLFGAALGARGRSGRLAAAVWLLALGSWSRAQCAVWRDTETLWRAADARAPSALALSNLGATLVEAGHFDEGVAVLESATRLYPRMALPYANLGVARLKVGDQRGAVEAFKMGLLREEPADLHAKLGRVLAAAGDDELPAAIAQLRAAIALTKDNLPSRFELAGALTRLGKYDEADAQYALVAGAEPKYPRLLANWGLLAARRGDAALAVSRYRRALYERDGRPEANYNWGNALMDAGRLDEAERHYHEAVRLAPELAQARVNLGNIAARRGRWREAAAFYRAALKTSPGLKEAEHNLAAVRRAFGL